MKFNQQLNLGENLVMIDENESYRILLKVIDGNKITKGDKFTACFDYSQIEGDIVLRSREDGDRFVPLGLKGRSKKLKDYFIDEKISREQRDKVMIFKDSKEIFWIGGHRLSENYKVKNNTTKILEIRIELL